MAGPAPVGLAALVAELERAVADAEAYGEPAGVIGQVAVGGLPVLRQLAALELGWAAADIAGSPWRPTVASGERLEDVPLNEWVGQALGSASMCWQNVGAAGEFDSRRAEWVLAGLMSHLNGLIDAVIAETTRAVAPAGAVAASGATARSRVERLHPDWSDARVAEEVAQILQDNP